MQGSIHPSEIKCYYNKTTYLNEQLKLSEIPIINQSKIYILEKSNESFILYLNYPSIFDAKIHK